MNAEVMATVNVWLTLAVYSASLLRWNAAPEVRVQEPRRSISPSRDSVILAFVDQTWHHGRFKTASVGTGWPRIPNQFFRRGDKARLDGRLGKYGIVKNAVWPWDVWEPTVWDYRPEELGGGEADFYRDHNGVRLIAFSDIVFDFGCSGLILSRSSKHSAALVNENLGALRTESGIGLGTHEDRVRTTLGKPFLTGKVSSYDVLVYVSRPTKESLGDWSAHKGTTYLSGHSVVIALKQHNVTEIGMFRWTDEPGGH